MQDVPEGWRICALDGCGEIFQAAVHNQRFHSSACTRIFTNARILQQYHERRKQSKKGRICSNKKCTTILSQYNTGNLCALHEHEQYVAKLIKWGWKIDPEL